VDAQIKSEAIDLSGYAASSIIKGQEVLIVSRAMEEQGTSGGTLSALQPSSTQALADITRAAADHQIQLQKVELEPGGASLLGAGPDWNAVEEFFEGLGQWNAGLKLKRLAPGEAASASFVIEPGVGS